MRPWPAPLRGTPHRWTLSTPSSTSASPSPARTSCSTPAPVLPQVAARLAQTFGGSLTHLYSHAVIGFSIRLSEDSARALALDPLVALVEEDGVVRASATQANPPWGLDRIEQRDLPLDDAYRYASEGAGVTAYVIDTGIRVSHQEFGGRASVGIDTVGDGQNGADCAGHGTHVAGAIGGATYGVAKSVRLVAVRVLDCAGGGEWSDVIAGVDWVTAQQARPAVANMSLGSSGSDTALETAVRNSIADGITYAIASGNDNNDACNHTPARVAEAITVNASTVSDWKASFSNFGPCTDIFAPGSSILSAWNTSDTASNTVSGTSMAAPHAAGAVALYLAGHPGASPAAVASHLTATATAMQGTDRLLLFTGLSVLTVRAPSADVVYGGAVPSGFPPTYVGLVSGESGPDTPATCTSTGHTGSAAGSYPITCAGAADSDYEIVYADGTLTVARAALDVRAPSVTVAYGTSVPMTFTPTYAGLVNGDTGSVTPATCTSTGHTGSPVGTYPITCSGASDPNYAIGYAAGTLTISRLGTVLTPSSLLSSLLRPTARLTRVDSGEGIAAQTIVFRAGTTTICSAVTSSVGVARCSRAVALATPLRAVYAGSPSYLPSSAPVPLA